jgi:predicted transcriptional regulator
MTSKDKTLAKVIEEIDLCCGSKIALQVKELVKKNERLEKRAQHLLDRLDAHVERHVVLRSERGEAREACRKLRRYLEMIKKENDRLSPKGRQIINNLTRGYISCLYEHVAEALASTPDYNDD